MSGTTAPVRDSSHASFIGPRVNVRRRTPQPCTGEDKRFAVKIQCLSSICSGNIPAAGLGCGNIGHSPVRCFGQNIAARTRSNFGS